MEPKPTDLQEEAEVLFQEVKKESARLEALQDPLELEKIIEGYSKVLLLNPFHAKAFHNRGILKKKLERYEDALLDANKAIELDPTFA
jgi:tetratricopeptide (TPR) repeat protein